MKSKIAYANNTVARAAVGDGGGDGEAAGGLGVAVPVAIVGRHHLDAVGAYNPIVEALAGGGVGVKTVGDGGEGDGGETVVGVVEGRVGIGATGDDEASVEAVGHTAEEGVGAGADGGRGGAPLVEGGVGEVILEVDSAAEGRQVVGRCACRHIDALHALTVTKHLTPAMRGGRWCGAQEGNALEGVACIDGLPLHPTHRGGYHQLLHLTKLLQRGRVHRVQRVRQFHQLGVATHGSADNCRMAHRRDGVGVGAVAHGRGDDNPLANNVVVAPRAAGGGRGDLEAEGLAAGEGGVEGGELGGGAKPQRHGHRDGKQSDKRIIHRTSIN